MSSEVPWPHTRAGSGHGISWWGPAREEPSLSLRVDSLMLLLWSMPSITLNPEQKRFTIVPVGQYEACAPQSTPFGPA